MYLTTSGILGVESARSVYQAIVDGLVTGSGYALLGVAFALILGVTGRFHFAFAIVYTATAYSAALVLQDGGWPLLAAAIAGLVLGCCLAVLIDLVVYRPIAHRAGDNALLGIFVAGLGVSITGENLIRFLWGSDSRGMPGFPDKSLSLIQVDFSLIEGAQVLASIGLILALDQVLRRTTIGQQVQAVRGNPEMAQALGVRLTAVAVVVFAAGSFIAGVAALFDGMRFAATPDMGTTPVFYAFVVAFIAGVARSPVVVGLVGFGLGLLQQLSTLWVSETMSTLTVFGLLFFWLAGRVLPRAAQQLSSALSRQAVIKPSQPIAAAEREV